VIADGKLYFVRRSGDGYVIKLGETFEHLASNRFATEYEFSATPAVSDGQLFFRANRTLFCVARAD
jgi:outer membrane protein assembly factor BamB